MGVWGHLLPMPHSCPSCLPVGAAVLHGLQQRGGGMAVPLCTLTGAQALLGMGRPGVSQRFAGGKQDAEVAVARIQAGAGDVTWVVWHRTCLAGFPSSFSLPAPCRLCIRQFTLAVDAGRRRAEAGGSGAETVWAGGGPSARASSVCDTRLVSPEWESC